MSSTVYQESFGQARPHLSFNAVAERLSLARAYTTDLSHYFRERAALEDAYVKSLAKLSSRLHSGGSGSVMPAVEALALEPRDEQRQLGAWNGVRERLEREIGETARVHDAWRKKVLDDVEGPLRFSLTKPDWLRYQQGETALGSTVREYEATMDKINKAQLKGNTKPSKSATSKLLTAQSHLASLGSSLTSGLPPFLASAQAVDNSHAAFLTEALVRYGTLESDLGRERMEAGERFLNAVLAIDRESELEGWALRESMRAGGQVAGRERAESQLTASSGQGEFGTSSTNGLGNGNGNGSGAPRLPSIVASPQPIQEESALADTLRAPGQPDRTRSPSTSRPAAPPPAALALPTSTSHDAHPSPSKPSKFISSIFKRDRSSSTGASKYGALDAPALQSDRASFESRDSDSVPLPEDPTASFARSQSSSLAAPGKKRESMMPFGGGGSLFRRPSRANSHGASPAQQETRQTESAFLAPPTPHVEQTAAVDDEGYSLPPAGYDKQPWEANAGASTNLMDDDEDEPDATAAHLQTKLPSVAIAPTTITEGEVERRAALERVKSTLLSSKSLGSPLGLGGPSAGVTRRATARGRRDVRMTTYNPTLGDDVPLAQIIEQQRAAAGVEPSTPEQAPSRSSTMGFAPYSASPTGTMLSMSTAMNSSGDGRANSILSTSSSHAAATRPDPFAGATTPGLRASITETVNVLLKGGEVTRVMIAGEIALSHRPSSSGAPVRIKIAHFEQFEKAAPNAAFLAPLPDAPGEYLVSPALAGAGTTATVLKYQLHVPLGAERTFVPLLVRASWKCDAGLSRVIVHYEPNPLAKLAVAAPNPFGEDQLAALEDVAFQVPVSCPVSTFQAKPAAEWNPDKARLAFKVDHVAFGAKEDKLLASVTTDGTAVPAPIAVGWKVVGRCLSAVGVEVVGEEEVEDVVRTTVAGKYLVAP